MVYSGDGTCQTYPLDKPLTKIGRSPDNDIVLTDADKSVSRSHAAITANENGSLVIEDLKSANGTFLNGRLLKSASRLTPTDQVKVGAFQLRLANDSGDSEGFDIEAGSVELDELQQKPQLLPFTGRDTGSVAELRNVELLYEIGVTLARAHSVEEVTNSALELLFKIEQVHRATVILWNEKKSSFDSLELRMRNAGKAAPLPAAYDPAKLVMSRTILNRVREQNRPLLIRETESEDNLDNALSIVRAGIQAAFCSPLSFRGRFLGIIYADNLAQPDAFSSADFRTFAAIAAQTGLALASAVANRELVDREVERQALKRYVPAQVADLILEAGGTARLNGDLQPVTVLYADIRGFTTMSEKMDAREIVAMLREFFSDMSAAILECGGTVDKFIGDCIMALFGAPIQSDRSIRDGVKAAIGMQRKMQEANQARLQRGAPPIQIGIGLHSGPAVVGNIGSGDRVQYTAIGDTVNVAARLVSKAAASQIIVSADIREALPEYQGFDPLGEMELKGRAARLNVFSVRWADQSIN
jgi:adenylate cyclase